MIITDLNGTPIEVTDLDKALAQADSFRGYKHTDNTHKDFTQYDQTNLQWYDQTQCSKEALSLR